MVTLKSIVYGSNDERQGDQEGQGQQLTGTTTSGYLAHNT